MSYVRLTDDYKGPSVAGPPPPRQAWSSCAWCGCFRPVCVVVEYGEGHRRPICQQCHRKIAGGEDMRCPECARKAVPDPVDDPEAVAEADACGRAEAAFDSD